MSGLALVLGYFGPETVLPVTSMVATIVGLFMIMGRHTLRLILRAGWLLVSGPRRILKAGHRTYTGPHIPRERSHGHLAGPVGTSEEDRMG
jgi:hypothetical protein